MNYLSIYRDGSSDRLLIPAIDAGPILESLELAFFAEEQGWGSDRKVEKLSNPIRVEFMPASMLKDTPEPLKKATADYEAAAQRWLAEYNMRIAAEKEVAELKAKLESVKNNVA